MKIDFQQTCKPPRGKNIEILNLKLGKVVKCTEKWKKSDALNFLRVISDYHFKAGAVDNHHQSSSSLLTSLRSSRQKSWCFSLSPFCACLAGHCRHVHSLLAAILKCEI